MIMCMMGNGHENSAWIVFATGAIVVNALLDINEAWIEKAVK